MDIKVGRVYRGKKPSIAGGMFVNDRAVIWVGSIDGVQYDSPSVAGGRRYPKVTTEQFRKWAARDVTDELPKGYWMEWVDFQRSKKSSREEGR